MLFAKGISSTKRRPTLQLHIAMVTILSITHHFTQFDNASASILVSSNSLCDSGTGLFLQFLLNL